jgi:hypothetical protein
MSSPQSTQSDSAQAAQAGLAVALREALLALWPSLDLSDLRASLPRFKAAVAMQVRRYAQASATLAARQYRAQRVAAGVQGPFTPVPADPPTVEQVAQSVDWATQPLWNADVQGVAPTPEPAALVSDATQAYLDAVKEVDPPVDTRPDASTAIADAKARLAAAAERQVLDAGRDTIVDNVQRDRKAKAWARIAEPDACAFCAMLATRGAVYHVQRGEFKAHDNCRCHVEPVFTAYEPSAKVREWQALYAEATKGVYGSKNAQRAFRQAYEGREINVKRDTITRKTASGKTETVVRKPGERTTGEIRAELAALEKNLPRLTNDKQREYTAERIKKLRAQLA